MSSTSNIKYTATFFGLEHTIGSHSDSLICKHTHVQYTHSTVQAKCDFNRLQFVNQNVDNCKSY